MRTVKPVLPTRDTAVCVLLDLKEITVRLVSFWGNTETDKCKCLKIFTRSVTVSSVKNAHSAALYVT